MNQRKTDAPITMDDAHTFAQALIADGWLNDRADCVDALQRRLKTFLGLYSAPAAAPVARAGIEAWHTGMPLPDDTVAVQVSGNTVTSGELAELEAMAAAVDGERARFISAALRDCYGEESMAMEEVDDGAPLSADPDEARKELIARVDAARLLLVRTAA